METKVYLTTREICNKFIANPKINPETGGRLQYGKGPYLKYENLCKQYNINSTINITNNLSTNDEQIMPLLSNKLPVDEILVNFILQVDFPDLINLYNTNKEYRKILNNKYILSQLMLKYGLNGETDSFYDFIIFYLNNDTIGTLEGQLLYYISYIKDSWYSKNSNLLQCRIGNYKSRDLELCDAKNFLYQNGFNDIITPFNRKFSKTPYNKGKLSPDDKIYYEKWVDSFYDSVINYILSKQGMYSPIKL